MVKVSPLLFIFWRVKITLQEAQLKETLRLIVEEEGITQLPQGWLIRPKIGANIDFLQRLLEQLGAVAYSPAVNLFLLKERKPQDVPVCPACLRPL
jgi:hypothetical protein